MDNSAETLAYALFSAAATTLSATHTPLARATVWYCHAENTRVLAVPIKHAGLILVGPEDAMPSTEQLLFKPI